MKIEYPLTQQELKAGATLHFKKKMGPQILIALVAIITCVVLYRIYKEQTDLIHLLPPIISGLTVFVLLLFTYPGRAAKPAFQGKPDVLPHSITTT